MAVYAVTGKLGTGKTKFAVWRAQLALKTGRRVASNVDLWVDKLVGAKRTGTSYVRLPDKPSAFDLEAVGHGNPGSYDEDRNGVMILDELATWLNARAFQDKGRAALLDWLVHARKLGWDVYLIVQDAGMIDKQVRTALVEYEARCLRLDKVRLPLIGGIINDVAGMFREGGDGGRWGYLPRMHLVAARVGEGANSVVAERWTYRGDWLHAAYDTRQVFKSDYPHGAHSVLHPGRFIAPQVVRRWWEPKPRPRPALKPKLPGVELASKLKGDAAWQAARAAAMGT
jgi:hypothetical protein